MRKLIFVLSVLVSYQSWRSGWNQTSCPLQSVISSLNTVNASKLFMCHTSPTSPIRTPPTRDSCEPLYVFISFLNVGFELNTFSIVFSKFLNSWFRNENSGFRRIVEKLERSPVCQRLPLRSFLVLPFQRITRLKLLVQVCMWIYSLFELAPPFFPS